MCVVKLPWVGMGQYGLLFALESRYRWASRRGWLDDGGIRQGTLLVGNPVEGRKARICVGP